jgi:primosomal protein N' (replication factor Y)
MTTTSSRSPAWPREQRPGAAATLYAEVAVDSTFPSRQTFSYRIPGNIEARVGMAAYVPFGKLTLQGIIVEIHDTPVFSEPEKIRDVRSLLGDRPLIDDDRVAVARWIAHEYIAPIFQSVAMFLPPGFERKPMTVIHPLVERDELDGIELPARLRETIERILDEPRPVMVDALKERLSFSTVDNALAALEKRGLIARAYTLQRPRITAKSVEVVSLAVATDEAVRRIEAGEPPKRSRRADVLRRLLARGPLAAAEAVKLAGSKANLERLLRAGTVRLEGMAIELGGTRAAAVAEIGTLTQTRRSSHAHAVAGALTGGEETLPVLREELAVDTSTVRWLADIGVVRIEQRHVERDPLAEFHVARRPAAELLAAQADAASAICDALDARTHRSFLLHGVTGSGKTEVYLHALERCVASGRRAIVLVPEIALTPQTVRRFRERFERVAVLHSGLTDGQLFDQWHGIAAGKYDVVIGARSAVFAPQPDLGLIVVDEEHEWTYKQDDPVPRYHAREVALELARRKRAVVVLGSATPDVATYEHATLGIHALLELPDRIRPVSIAKEEGGGKKTDEELRPSSLRPPPSAALPAVRLEAAAMPRIDIVDLREELKVGHTGMISRELRQVVESALAKDEQAILFLNRRGMAGHVQCRDCGFVPECGSCAVALTYHRQFDRLVCHQCNKRWRLPATCKQCGSPRVKLLGAGIEKVEAEAQRLFPHARLLRWDRDVTRTRGAHDRILASFLAREADILLGTQMLAKGLDMPAVTVVGVVNADTALHLPDFRSGERTFQLLTQVAGRAGRGERSGRVIIQTYTPDHYAIEAASRYDYEGFVEAELDFRRRAGYPPYGRLVQLTLTHPNARWAQEEALRLHKALRHRRAELGAEVDVVGPSPAYVPRVRGRWRWQILLRGRAPAELVREFVLPPHWSIDVDPASLV